MESVEAADRVLVMLNTLMDISEAESGAMPLRREAIHLSEIATRAVDLYREVAEAKGVTISIITTVDAVVSENRERWVQA